MRLVHEYKYKEWSITSFLVITLIIVIFYLVVPKGIVKSAPTWFFASVIAVLFVLRYPHELLHYIMAKAAGIDSEMKFDRLNAVCRPKDRKMLNWSQLAIIAAAPVVVLSVIGLLVIALTSNIFIRCVTVAVLLLGCPAYLGDIGYIYTALKYRKKNYMFLDTGLKLEIYDTSENIGNHQGGISFEPKNVL